MKRIVEIIFCVIILMGYYTENTLANVYVNGYQRKDGTYVQDHYRTKPNNAKLDNYSAKNNINPHTGEKGYKPRDNSDFRDNTNLIKKDSNTIKSINR